jgi:hypothetical protein
MRSIVLLTALLCGCSAPKLRCDSHLQAINPPAASAVSHAAADKSSVRRTP